MPRGIQSHHKEHQLQILNAKILAKIREIKIIRGLTTGFGIFHPKRENIANAPENFYVGKL